PNAFAESRGIKRIDLPESLKKLGGFENTSILVLKLPQKLESISKNAFDKTLIDSLTLPDSLVSFGGFAETAISEINLPKNLLHIEPNTLDLRVPQAKENKLILPEKLIS
ncbi:leucine-rich repeat domain-containing protein, partial [Escherichia coli]|nr:leucine-rich repeat domain-containing protein [Escherichia coli]